jgi:ketosteroid isomerase-like protein
MKSTGASPWDGSAAIGDPMSRFAKNLLVAAAILIAGCATASTESGECREIEEKTEAIESRANAGDVDTLLREFYAKEPIIAFAGQGVTKSQAEARQAWLEMMKHGQVELKTEAVERSSGMLAQMGEWLFRVQVAQGDFREERGRFFAVWKRTGGEWRVVMQSFQPQGGFVEND